MAAKYVTEVLKELNDDLSLFESTYKKTGENSVLEILFKHAYLPEYKFLLPPAAPPFKPNTAPVGMSPASFIQEIRKFGLFTRTDINNFKREMLFIQLLENLHPSESKILLAIKDQNLYKLYKNLTYGNIAKAGYLPIKEVVEEPVAKPVVEKVVKVRKPRVTKKPVFFRDEQPSQETINTVEE